MYHPPSQKQNSHYDAQKKLNSLAPSQFIIPFAFSRTKKKPNFLKERYRGIYEEKFSFLLIVEYNGYIVVYKNNVSKLKVLNEYIEPLDYEVISRLLVTDKTLYEKFNVTSINTADSALRNKTIEGVDLKGYVANISASKQIVNSMRIDNEGLKSSLSLNTSRINNLGNKISLKKYFENVVNVCDRIAAFGFHDSYLDIFAKPIDFDQYKSGLLPICILLKFDKLKQAFEDGLIDEVYREEDDGTRIEGFNIQDTFSIFDNTCQIDQESNTSKFKINNPVDASMELKIGKKLIRIQSEYFNSIKIDTGSTPYSLTEYLNHRNEFIVNFENTELVYTHGRLFKDHKLLGNIDSFLSVFETNPLLETTIDEKGTFTNGQTTFSQGSIFQFIETTVANTAELLICDDLGSEWADYISIENESITFFHAKHNDESLSASKLQEIIGQALKNMGHLQATEQMIDSKRDIWRSDYANDNAITSISRVRTAPNGNFDTGMTLFKKIINLPNTKRKIALVVDFISKQRLSDCLELLKLDQKFDRRTQVLQILWFVSSLVASGKEAGVEIHIICRP